MYEVIMFAVGMICLTLVSVVAVTHKDKEQAMAWDYHQINQQYERMLEDEWERYNEGGKPDEDDYEDEGYYEDEYEAEAYDRYAQDSCQ